MKTSSLHDPDGESIRASSTPFGGEFAPGRRYVVLLVDDDEGICALIKTWLVHQGHEVTCAFTGASAERLLAIRRFDVVITDIVMPDGDGFELMTAVKRLQPGARTLAISGGGKYLRPPECLKIARGLGANHALLKPFTREQFLEAFTVAATAG